MRKLGRKKSNRQSLIRNLVTSLLLYEKVDTTEAKAKELKREVELIIVKAKKNNLNSKRRIYGQLFDQNASKKLTAELVTRYSKRSSGFTTMSRIGTRLGDNSQKVRIELIDKKVFVNEKKTDQKENEIKVVKDKNLKSNNKTDKKRKLA